jgi:hypothetical protein
MKTRLIIIGIDDINRLFQDYARMTGYPTDAVCDTLLFNQQQRRMCLRVSSPSFGEHEPPEEIRFDLSRSFRV